MHVFYLTFNYWPNKDDTTTLAKPVKSKTNWT